MVKINKVLINLSMFLMFLIMTLRIFVIDYFGTSSIIVLQFCSCILLFISLIRNGSIKKNNLKFSLLFICILLPCFYNNVYLNEKIKLTGILCYIFTIIYSIFLCMKNGKEENILFFMKLLYIFSIVTSIVTWMSFLNPNLYINIVNNFFPNDSAKSVVALLNSRHVYSGLTDHYSRNAIFVSIGLLSIIYISNFYKYHTKKYIILSIFLMITLMLIGKRAHLLFLVISLIISYFVMKKISIKSISKFLLIILFSIFALGIIFKIMPETMNSFNRFFDSGVSQDISSGRFELYRDAINMYCSNNSKPIGWGGFAKNKNYQFAGVHNDYLQIFVETGIIGFIMIIGSNIFLLIYSMKRLTNSDQNLNLNYIIVTFNLFFMIYSLTGVPHYDVEVYMMYFILNSFLMWFNLKKERNI